MLPDPASMTTNTAAFFGASPERSPVNSRHAPIDCAGGPIRLSLTRDIASLRTRWLDLQGKSCCSFAQTYSCAEAWIRHVLIPSGQLPVIAYGESPSGQLRFIWPFETTQVMGQRVLRWLGQEQSNYNMGLFAPETAETFARADIEMLLAAIARQAGASCFLLERQPEAWDGGVNPFRLLKSQAAPNVGHAVSLGADFDALYHARFSSRTRSGMKRKERKLAELGEVAFGFASDASARLALLDTFFAQRSDRFAELGQHDAFADDETREFYRALAVLPESDPACLRIGYVTVGGQVAATFSGAMHHGRFIVIFSSLAESEELRKASPGALLIQRQIEHFCREGAKLYDMGAGNGRHKSDWCDVEQHLFDSMHAVGAAGQLVAMRAALKGRLKSMIKNDPRLWAIYDGARRRLYGRREPAAE
jgi:CelD/BcsL family acetyltransferase involved in cellulose biosynthesis